MNLLSLFSDQIGGTLIKQATGLLGESESGITKAMSGLMPSLLGTLVNKSGTTEGASSLMNLLSNNANDSILDNVSGLFSDKSKVSGLMDSSGGILNGLLGDKLGPLTGMLSKFGGIKSSSMGGLLKLATPFLLGFLKRKVMNKGASGLMSLLGGQKKHIASAMPAGLSGVSDLLGFGNFGKDEKTAEVKRPTHTPAKKKTNWIPLLLGLLAVLGGLWFMNRGGNETKVETPPVVEKVQEKIKETPVVETPTYNFQMVDYPGGTFAGVRNVVSFDNMKGAFETGYQSLGKAGVTPTGSAAGVFYSYDETKKETDMVAAFPVAKGSKYDAPITVFDLPAGKAVMLEYMGDYDAGYTAHTALGKYMEEKGLKQGGVVLERYLVGPNETKNPKEYKTQIFYFYE